MDAPDSAATQTAAEEMELAPPSARARQGYEALYDTMRAAGGGTLPRKQLHAVLRRSGLPAAKLAAVWRLVGLARPADAHDDEAAGAHEFVVAMHLAECCRRQRAAALPATLPEWAWREWLAE